MTEPPGWWTPPQPESESVPREDLREVCDATLDGLQCSLERGHEGAHRATVQWL